MLQRTRWLLPALSELLWTPAASTTSLNLLYCTLTPSRFCCPGWRNRGTNHTDVFKTTDVPYSQICLVTINYDPILNFSQLNYYHKTTNMEKKTLPWLNLFPQQPDPWPLEPTGRLDGVCDTAGPSWLHHRFWEWKGLMLSRGFLHLIHSPVQVCANFKLHFRLSSGWGIGEGPSLLQFQKHFQENWLI